MADRSLGVESLRELLTSSTEPDPLARVAGAAQLAVELQLSADQLVDGVVAEARQANYSWAQIGGALGVTRQAAQQRFVTRVEPAEPGKAAYVEGCGGRFLAAAAEEARELGGNYVGTEHMLLALLDAGDEIAAHALTALGITANAVRERIREIVGGRAPREWEALGVRPNLKRTLELAQREARRFGHSQIGSQHVLLALLRVDQALAVEILADLGADPPRVRGQLAEMLGVTVRELEARPVRRRRQLRPRPGERTRHPGTPGEPRS
jgi:hypothetical protein